MMKRDIVKLSIVLLLASLAQGCSLMNRYDDSALSDSTSGLVRVQNYLTVHAYRKEGLGAAEKSIGFLKRKTKLPPGRYRLAVSIDEYSFGRSFVPISLTLDAKQNGQYWIAAQKNYLTKTWRPYVAEKEPKRFYGLLEIFRD